jgi:molecular chaperone GrpE
MDDEKDKLETGASGAASKGNGKDDEDIHIEVLEPEEAPLSLEEPSATSSEIIELEKQLMELRKEKEEIYDRLLRKHADFENYRKRIEKDKREFRQYVLAEFLSELLPILDNFERALSHSDEQPDSQYRRGVELIYRQLRDLMERKGLKEIEIQDQPFDPNFHEAIARELRNDLPENTILEQLQKGYLFHNKLLRPAMVKVSYRAESLEESTPDVAEQPEAGEEIIPDSTGEGGWENNES